MIYYEIDREMDGFDFFVLDERKSSTVCLSSVFLACLVCDCCCVFEYTQMYKHELCMFIKYFVYTVTVV